MNPNELIRNAIQKLLDVSGDGYLLEEFVLAMSLQRLNSDGEVESVAWVWSPAEQADWKTDGLLQAALDLRHCTDIDTD